MGYGGHMIWDTGYMGYEKYGKWDKEYGIWDMVYGIWDMEIWDMGEMGYGI